MTSNVLVVSSGANHANSVSRKLVTRYATGAAAKGAVVVHRDLAEGIPFVDTDWHDGVYSGSTEPAAAAALALSDSIVNEVLAADTIVITAPMYNFGIPATLKAWVDQLVRRGLTFTYTPEGPVGLIPAGKKVIVVVPTGGVPVGSNMDFVTPYLKFTLGFIGLTNVEIVAVDGMNQPNAAEKVAAAEAQIDAAIAA